MTPAGFEDLLGHEATPTELLYLDKTIDEGEIVLSGYGAKRYRSGGQELELDKPYRCASSTLIRDIIDDEGLCGAMSFTLREKYEDRVQLVYLQPDDRSVPALNQHFGIEADSGADTREREHISRSTVDTVSGSIRYNANFTEGDNSNGSLSLTGQVSYAEYLIEAEPTFDRYNGDNSLNVGKLLGSRTYAGIKHELGFKPSSQNDLINSSIGVIPSRNMVGGWYSSTSETFRNKQQGTGSPLQVFMPFTGMIEVYRDNRLLYVTRAAAGMAQIPVADFPIGVYDVSIVRRSLSGEELEAITDTVSNSLTDSGFTLALGMMNSGERQLDVLDGDYDDLVAGFAYQSKANDYTTGSFSILNIGTAQYFQSTINYQPAFPLGVELSTEFNIQSKDWGINLQTNYAGTLLGKMVNSNFSYRFSDLLETESHSYFFNVSLMPNHRYSRLFMINAHASKVNAPQYREDYSELNIENQNAVSFFGVPANLSTSLGTSSTDDLLATLSLNFTLGARQDYSLSTNFTYTGQRESSYGEAILSQQMPEESKLSQLTFSAGGGEEFVRLGADADFRFDSANAYLGGFVYRDARQGTYNSNQYGRASGNMYFSGTQYAFDRNGASSGVIVKMDTQPGSNIEVRADVSGGNSVRLRDSNTLVTVPSFTESSMYINSSNAVIDDYSHDYVLYKGNFAFLSIDPRQTFEAAGYIDFSDLGGDSVTLKNHESKVTVSNHESNVDVRGTGNEEYFQLTVSRQYPVIELFDGQGRSLCTVELDDSLTASNSQEFVYLGKVGCRNG
ncbi:TPA: TcfC E-set like domain-containing protein [Vibrio parahaemolyticus]|nr:TcfC E-set like domain-containing protein [Vibrio parahaemolyticus]HCG6702080.1 TcfC E-set like domain-containing protein [Vibrio parahaemolyticus]HCG6712594.1 TcfC E-set like domain-containing protein [Vibrio parahaemolyticus]